MHTNRKLMASALGFLGLLAISVCGALPCDVDDMHWSTAVVENVPQNVPAVTLDDDMHW